MYKMLLLGILAVSPLFADVNCSINRKCDSSWENAKTQYSPPILANGDIGTIVDYRNCQF